MADRRPVPGRGLDRIVAARLPERFRSDTLIQVVPQQVPDTYVRSTVDTPGDRSVVALLETVKQQVLSRTRLERLILELNLYPKERRSGIMEEIVEGMRRDVDVQMLPKGDAFRVSFTYRDPRLAMQVANKLASQFMDERTQDRKTFADSTTEFLDTQLQDARRRLVEVEKNLADYRTKHAGELPTEREANLQVLSSTQAQVQQLAESVNRDRDRRYLLERTLAELTAEPVAVAAAVPAGAPDASPQPGQSATEQLQAARAVLAALELRFTPDHPDVQRAKRIVADLEIKAQQEALQKPVSPDAGSSAVPATPQEALRLARIRDLRLEIEGIDRVIASKYAEQKTLLAKIAEYQRRVEATPARESELTSLLRDYDTVQKLYATLNARQEESKIAANLELRQIGERFRTLDQARFPEKPISPNRPLINLAGALAGLVVGLCLVGLKEYKDDSFHTDEEVLKVLSLPVIATVPVMPSAAERRATRRRGWMAAAGGVALLAAGIAGVIWSYWR